MFRPESTHFEQPTDVLLARLPRGNVSSAHDALVGLDDAQVLDNFENAVAGLGDVQVHPGVMLTGHHGSRTTRPRSNLCVVERLDDGFLIQRACLFHRSLPELESSTQEFMTTAAPMRLRRADGSFFARLKRPLVAG